MTQPFDDLIAELDAAKADVARSVRKSRAFIADRDAGGGELPPLDGEPAPADRLERED
jgi:hypothetical protein